MLLTPAADLRLLPASLALACGLALALPAAGQEPADSALDPVRFGPPAIRDEQLLAQPRLTLPAASPDPIGRGTWEIRLSTLWSNSFGWNQDVPGEHPSARLYLIDGEAATLDATIRRGLTPDLDVGLRVPLRWRGGGVMDGLIDFWHRTFHLPDGGRPLFLHDAFRIEGLTTAGTPFSVDRTGLGLGNLELDARWRLHGGGAESVSAALVVRASVPTGTDPFGGNGFGGGFQLVVAAPLGRRFDLYGGIGFTAQDPGPVDGIRYATARIHGFAAVEWRLKRRIAAVVETDAASRLVENIASYPGLHWMVNVTGRFQVARGTRLDVGITENIKDQEVTTDFAVYFAVAVRR